MTLTLGDQPLPLSRLVALACQPQLPPLELSAAAWHRLRAARAVVEAMLAGDQPVYGLNTGLGSNVGLRLSPAEIEAFQTQVIAGRSVAMGPPLPDAVVRAALVARLAGLAAGRSGVSLDTARGLLAMVNAGIVPVIGTIGGIGAGDLALNCAWAGVLIGLGQAHLGDGHILAADQALAARGLAPVTLQAKDALGLINTSPVSTGHGALVAAALARTLLTAAAVAALSLEGYGGNLAILRHELHALRPAAGQVATAALLRALTAGGAQAAPGAAGRIQDAISMRTLPPAFGAALAVWSALVSELTIELNSGADSPAVLAETGEMLSTVNFQTCSIAVTADAAAVAVAGLATGSAWRLMKLQTSQLSGLPRFLSPVGGAATGFNSLQKTVAHLQAAIRLKAVPASTDSLPLSETVEDLAPQTPLALAKLSEQVAHWQTLIACEALCGAQAADLRAGMQGHEAPLLGAGSAAVYRAVRAVSPMVQQDRPLGADVMAVTQALGSPALARALAPLAAGLTGWAEAAELGVAGDDLL